MVDTVAGVSWTQTAVTVCNIRLSCKAKTCKPLTRDQLTVGFAIRDGLEDSLACQMFLRFGKERNVPESSCPSKPQKTQDLARKTTYTLRSTSDYRCRQRGTYWLSLSANMQDTGAGEVLDMEYIGPPVNLAGGASMTIWFGGCCMQFDLEQSTPQVVAWAIYIAQLYIAQLTYGYVLMHTILWSTLHPRPT